VAGVDLVTIIPKPCSEKEDTTSKKQISQAIFMQKATEVDQVRSTIFIGNICNKTCNLKYK
jgi:hypothetical protein